MYLWVLLLAHVLASASLLVPIDRLLYRSGAFERREHARAAIAGGRVSINGANTINKNRLVPSSTILNLDHRPLPSPPPTRVLALHKPRGTVTTCGTVEGQNNTVIDVLRRHNNSHLDPTIVPVGRLDQDSEGLLLLTNDGTLAKLLLERGACSKTYVALVAPRAPTTERTEWLRRMEQGVLLRNGYVAQAARCRLLEDRADALGAGCADFEELLDAAFDSRAGSCQLVEIMMRQGGKREVRRLLKAVGFRTMRLCRVAVGGVTLGGLASGEVSELPRALVLELYAEACARADAATAAMPTYDAERRGWVPASELASLAASPLGSRAVAGPAR